MDYNRLIRDHDRIDRLASTLEVLVKGDTIKDDAVNGVLSSLKDAVSAHLASEDSFIYPDMVESADPAGASTLVIEFEEIKRDWQDYLATWDHGTFADDWSSFRQSTRAMLARLRERVMKETGLLYAMALRQGLITMTVTA